MCLNILETGARIGAGSFSDVLSLEFRGSWLLWSLGHNSPPETYSSPQTLGECIGGSFTFTQHAI